MPGFTTHYLFGSDTYRSLKCTPLKRNLYYNRAAYALGLQGPDIFFYYLPSYAIHGSNIGALAHCKRSGEFYHNLIESRNQFVSSADRKICDAYLIGFLGHYTLDTICHPFIYARTNYTGNKKDYFGRHAYLEVDIDSALLYSKLHKLPSEFHQANTIILSPRQRHVVARMLYFAYKRTYPEYKIRLSTMILGIYSMQIGLRLLHDTTGQKKVAARFIEGKLLGFPNFSPLVPSDTLQFCKDPFNMKHDVWRNPWNPELTSDETFFDLYEKAVVLYRKRIHLLNAYLRCPDDSDCAQRNLQAFLSDYGDLSFHSGLPIKNTPDF